eukprot:TRINITY_DN3939_c0_g1_i2.p3 TRINITY_DN3939_c0_g1~~TRINITY_DN3939_c0_g1_i2.p3  ORF type:complete len:136 (-),score=14.35 TRINITY_DN3939_c0_g1_i2:23-430(-)
MGHKGFWSVGAKKIGSIHRVLTPAQHAVTRSYPCRRVLQNVLFSPQNAFILNIKIIQYQIGSGTSMHQSSHVLCVDTCLLYTSDAADDTPCVDLGGRRIIKKKKNKILKERKIKNRKSEQMRDTNSIIHANERAG